MFFRKSHQKEENVAEKSVKKMDTLVTGMILGGIIASIYGVKKLRDHQKEEEHRHEENMLPPHEDHAEKREKKRSILSRIIFGNK